MRHFHHNHALREEGGKLNYRQDDGSVLLPSWIIKQGSLSHYNVIVLIL